MTSVGVAATPAASADHAAAVHCTVDPGSDGTGTMGCGVRAAERRQDAGCRDPYGACDGGAEVWATTFAILFGSADEDDACREPADDADSGWLTDFITGLGAKLSCGDRDGDGRGEARVIVSVPGHP